MFPIPSTEKLIETKICRHCSVKFPITDKDLEFYEKVSPTFGGKKYQIPTPTLCPDCRQQRRLSFRNERKLYKRKCDATGKEIISIYSPDKPYKIFDQDYWWSDKWDPLAYGRDFDFSRSFFDQFRELVEKTPLICLHGHSSNENSTYTNYFVQSKNCYLCFGGWFDENVSFSSLTIRSKNCFDMHFSFDCEHCYEGSYLRSCMFLSYADMCTQCHFSSFLEQCNGCEHCFGCVNLSNKRYHIFNQGKTKEEYEDFMTQYRSDTLFRRSAQDKAQLFIHSSVRKNLDITNSENSIGNHLANCNNVNMCANAEHADNLKYVDVGIIRIHDSFDCDHCGVDEKLLYEIHNSSMNVTNCSFCNVIRENCARLLYTMNSNGTSDCFGCVSLKNKQYCILNKQYTKEEYEALVPKIIEHMTILRQGSEGQVREWGEFFPSSLSPFGYNETTANEFYPLSKKKALEEDFVWSDFEAPFQKGEKIIPASKLPDDISKITDDILNWAIECEVTKKPFRIIKQELEFYRKHNLPIPRRHPDQRHLDRMALRNPRKLFERKCDKCKIDILTTYAPERPERVYCEACYTKEAIG